MSSVPTTEEVKECVQTRYAIDEARMINLLRGQLPQSAVVIMTLGLARALIRQTFEKLEQNRALQVTLSSILCTTRFKFYESGALLKTTCARCGGEDSFLHLVRCVGLSAPMPTIDPDNIIEFLVELTNRAHQMNPGLPIPKRDEQHLMQDAPQLQL